jgi:hypothetical protein
VTNGPTTEGMNAEARSLLAAGWLFDPAASPLGSTTIARAIEEGHAGLLEATNRPHGGPCPALHGHRIHRYCRHGGWLQVRPSRLPWRRAAQRRWLENVCTCRIGVVVSEYHPVSAANQMRRELEPAMRAWVDRYLAGDPRGCRCVPTLRAVTLLDERGAPSQLAMLLWHESDRCPIRREPVEAAVVPADRA